MNEYNKQFGLRDIFMNPALAGVFPQFEQNERLQNVYSFAETEARVQKYLVGALNATVTGNGEITVKGKHGTVLRRVRQLQPLIEGLFNNMPKVAQALRANTRLYLPYATQKQMEDIKTPAGKQRALKLVLDNFQYNSDLGALNSIKNEPPEQFNRNKKAWETRVGHRRLKHI
jgi:hypothetical protein